MIHQPEPGKALVRLSASPWGNIPVPSKPHDSVSYGEVIALHPDDQKAKGYLVGRVGHWHLYRDDVRLPDNLAIIELADILATSYKEEN